MNGFPEAGKGKYNPKSDRKRWVLPDGSILEWDYQHGTVEKYDKTGKKHLGEYNPENGQLVDDPVPGRSTPKMNGISWWEMAKMTWRLATNTPMTWQQNQYNPQNLSKAAVQATGASAALYYILTYGPLVAF